MKEIIYDVNKLREPSTPVTFITEQGQTEEEAKQIIAELTEIMENDKTIIALAAPQIGINKRVFCIRFNDVIKTFINPIITKKAGCSIRPEICSALPGKEILIARPEEITTVYYNDVLKYEDNKLLGPAARIFDQMSQLLDGILPSDLGLVSDIEEDGSLADATEEEIQQIIEYYKQFIRAKTRALEESINTSEEEATVYRQLKFTESVINGRTQIVEQTPHYNRETRRAMAKAARRKK